ncbi:hypothetical protein [Robiginitalea sp. SC105]|uniref:hypothetical protein n=1 Tax=Robiginitalea sp. SC105 TaxID=2762332 RepID=UPI001639722B|nr:hypothetical protein [Robiginitalea sp. SC105]MBC2838407.1 hypothetical protein [Robiginitalea sp. SC105]
MTGTELETTFITEYQLEIGTFRFYKNLVIGKVHEGQAISLDDVLPVIAIGIEFYNAQQPAVYLSDREFSYSLDPTLHLEAHKLFPFLLGYGAVVYNELNLRIARLEQRFLPCPSGIFTSMEEGLAWAQKLIEGHAHSRPHR